MKSSLEVISPASGTVMDIRVNRRINIAIFLAPFDNHWQYAPADGIVTKVIKIRGGNAPAFLGHSSSNNKIETHISTKAGDMVVRQVTGILFRRLINNLKEGDTIKKRERIGRIVLGSRVELEMPMKISITIKRGEHIEGGKTIIGHLL